MRVESFAGDLLEAGGNGPATKGIEEGKDALRAFEDREGLGAVARMKVEGFSGGDRPMGTDFVGKDSHSAKSFGDAVVAGVYATT